MSLSTTCHLNYPEFLSGTVKIFKNRSVLGMALAEGFGVLTVNYSGTVGYGLDHHERLVGQVGRVDVDDCLNSILKSSEFGFDTDNVRQNVHHYEYYYYPQSYYSSTNPSLYLYSSNRKSHFYILSQYKHI